MFFHCFFQEEVDLEDPSAAPNSTTSTAGAGGQQPVFAMPPPPATGVNPFTGAPVAAATEQTSLNTTEQTTYTPGI